MRFKIGDKVKIIEPFPPFKKGDIVTITATTDWLNEEYYCVSNIPWWRTAVRFELYDPQLYLL